MRNQWFHGESALAFASGLSLALSSWKWAPPSIAVKAFAAASGIGWFFVFLISCAVAACFVGLSESRVGHRARKLHAWLHTRLVVRLHRAVAFLLGVLVVPALVAVTEWSIAPLPAILYALLLLFAMGCYAFCLNTMAHRLRERGYLRN